MVLKPDAQSFCTQCGLPLKQPCPHCRAPLPTPAQTFTSCPECATDFWSCLACGRLYHLDRTSCQNSYCQDKGGFWTRRFGEDTWSPGCVRAVDWEETKDDAPTPCWLSEAAMVQDRRWPSLHTLGLLVSVQETGVLELWSEQGAPQAGVAGDFQETSVCLSRLDLGENAPCPPLRHQDQILLVGSETLSLLEMTANPSVGKRFELPEPAQGAVDLGDEVLLWGQDNLYRFELGEAQFERVAESPGQPLFRMTVDHSGGALLVTEAGAYHYSQHELEPLDTEALAQKPEWALFCDRFIVIRRNQLAYLEGHQFIVTELPDSVIAPPLYCPASGRLFLLLNDNTIRSCTSVGQRFSFISELAGVPTTVPLKIGERIFYGTEGRYLCRDEEALRPRLSSQPVGELSYANGRLFGATMEGGLFAFQL